MKSWCRKQGGADEVTLAIPNKQYPITKMGTKGLWRGLITFEEAGEHVSSIEAVDGAGNITKREWIKFKVAPKGQITQNGLIVKNSMIRVFVLDPTTKKYQQWESEEYGIPGEMKSENGLGLVLPNGSYYLQLEGEGQKIISQKIVLDKTTNIASNWEVGSGGGIWQEVMGFLRKIKLVVPLRRVAYLNLPKLSNTESKRPLTVGREQWIGKKSLVLIGGEELPWHREMVDRAKVWASEVEAQLIILQNEQELGLLPQVYLVNDKGDTVEYKEGIWER